ncbi:MAG: hypothetical protein IJ753_04345 [Bacteroidales bacterium]|nr:hypothetical protein [Bacteroidales bacterium]
MILVQHPQHRRLQPLPERIALPVVVPVFAFFTAKLAIRAAGDNLISTLDASQTDFKILDRGSHRYGFGQKWETCPEKPSIVKNISQIIAVLLLQQKTGMERIIPQVVVFSYQRYAETHKEHKKQQFLHFRSPAPLPNHSGLHLLCFRTRRQARTDHGYMFNTKE